MDNDYGAFFGKDENSWVCPVCGREIDFGAECPKCHRVESDFLSSDSRVVSSNDNEWEENYNYRDDQDDEYIWDDDDCLISDYDDDDYDDYNEDDDDEDDRKYP